jgi:hypothetical protein
MPDNTAANAAAETKPADGYSREALMRITTRGVLAVALLTVCLGSSAIPARPEPVRPPKFVVSPVPWTAQLYAQNREYIEVKIDTSTLPKDVTIDNVTGSVLLYDADRKLIKPFSFRFTDLLVPGLAGAVHHIRRFPHSTPVAQSAEAGSLHYKLETPRIEDESGRLIHPGFTLLDQRGAERTAISAPKGVRDVVYPALPKSSGS